MDLTWSLRRGQPTRSPRVRWPSARSRREPTPPRSAASAPGRRISTQALPPRARTSFAPFRAADRSSTRVRAASGAARQRVAGSQAGQEHGSCRGHAPGRERQHDPLVADRARRLWGDRRGHAVRASAARSVFELRTGCRQRDATPSDCSQGPGGGGGGCRVRAGRPVRRAGHDLGRPMAAPTGPISPTAAIRASARSSGSPCIRARRTRSPSTSASRARRTRRTRWHIDGADRGAWPPRSARPRCGEAR
jgi:hypothetical protein